MKRRLYFLLTGVAEAKTVVSALLMDGMARKQMHIFAKEGVDLAGLPAATLFQKSDVIRSLLVGLGFGVLAGLLAGFFLHHELAMPLSGWMFFMVILGGFIGAWSASMVGMTVKNSRLKPFSSAIDEGQLLLILEVPYREVEATNAFMQSLQSTP